MRTAFRLAGPFLALALLAAPAAGLCAALVGVEGPCAMRESHQAASCGHAEMAMTDCCKAESVDLAAAGILRGPAGDVAPPALSGTGSEAPENRGFKAAASACEGDPPPAVPRYRLYSALLL